MLTIERLFLDLGLELNTEVMKKVDKCVMLCANCHREVHAGKLQLPRETVVEKPGELRETLKKGQS